MKTGNHEDKPFTLLCCCEGYLEGVVHFKTEAERTAYAEGFSDGSSNYGAGDVDTIPYEDLADESLFDKDGDGPYDYLARTTSLESLREAANWKPE